MKTVLIFSFYLILSSVTFVNGAEPPSEDAAIRQAALDYIESWYEGDDQRMEKCLHPQFAKRRVLDAEKVDHLDRQMMVQLTKGRLGMGTPKDKQLKDVTILDVYESMASVKVVSFEFVDYLHLAKTGGRWLIINAIWDFN